MTDKPLRKNDIKTLTPIEAVLKRPGMYVGNVTESIIPTYIYEDNKIVLKDLPQIPALLKINSEILDNSLDEAIRTFFKYATTIKMTFDKVSGKVTIKDNGRGLPIEYNETLKKWTPEEIFTTLHSGSNFEDDDPEKQAQIGMNGVGSSITAIMSQFFEVETANGSKYYKQTFENHLAKKSQPKIKDSKENYTTISYIPNYNYFNVSEEAKEKLDLLYRKRIKDLSFAYPEITFYYQGEKLAAPNLKSFLKQIHPTFESNEIDNNRIGLFYSDTEFAQLSFVNGACTSRAGEHVTYATGVIVDHIRAFLKKKHKIDVKPIDIKNKLFLILSIRIKNPVFDSQTKENLISKTGFKEIIDSLLTKKFLDSILKNEEIILPIVETYKLKQQVQENLELKKQSKTLKKVRVEKFYPASGRNKYLVLTEGDGANGLLMSVLGRSEYSYFPLMGKPLNALEAKLDKIVNHKELKGIREIMNLRLDKDDQRETTHEYILFATDQDADGQDIKALLLCYFYRFAKSLLLAGKIKFLRTPLVIAFKGEKISKYFFDLKSYRAFETENPNKGYTYKYYKGLGTHTPETLQSLIKSDGIEKFIQTLVFDEEAEKALISWMSKEDAALEYRKEKVGNNSFDINAA